MESHDYQVGINYVERSLAAESEALWFSLPDIIASVVLTGKVPRIIDAFRIEAVGISRSLKETRLRGAIDADPRSVDFFKLVIEERKRLASDTTLPKEERDRLDKFLKVLANATSYGIYAQMDVQDSDEQVRLTCSGIDPEPYSCVVDHPEKPGEYCFPPLASLITGGARLMLALLEHSVTELGGTYAMEDTDSMAIVSTKEGGLVPCPGGPHRLPDGRHAVWALSWSQISRLQNRFEPLKPYDPQVVTDRLLKIEDVNRDPITGEQRQIWCLAISAKRYALFLIDEAGEPQLLRKGVNSTEDGWTEHGLGHLLNPTDPESEDREWIAQVWLYLIRESLGLPAVALSFVDVPAVGRISVTSPELWRRLKDLNEGKAYADQIKPFNFLLTAQVIPFGHPTGVDADHFHLIAPYESDPRKWLKMKWIDQYSGKQYRITTAGAHGGHGIARVKTFADVLSEHAYHPESKCADADGEPCGKGTVGLLQRRHIQLGRIVYIGKESNRLEDVEAGMIDDEDSVYTEYPDPRRDEWTTKFQPAIAAQIELAELIQLFPEMSRRALINIRAGRARPHRKNMELLMQRLSDWLKRKSGENF
jgi:hypothetical protein